MARRSGLGRGLGALIPSEAAGSPSGMREIALAKIRPNKLQPRTYFDEAALASLVDSIRAVGILQPVLVREVG
ncbi:MAG TPA: ParB N-terminal domain-containing protein, partial [Acidimicrobiales bacterium]|nr:ParB N-terminal domain-containing protein [Acidimicrobiales bacterium]